MPASLSLLDEKKKKRKVAAACCSVNNRNTSEPALADADGTSEERAHFGDKRCSSLLPPPPLMTMMMMPPVCRSLVVFLVCVASQRCKVGNGGVLESRSKPLLMVIFFFFPSVGVGVQSVAHYYIALHVFMTVVI